MSGSERQASAAPRVPYTLARLKFRLLRNRARGTRNGSFRFLISALWATMVAVLGFVGAVGLGRSGDPRASRAALVIGATALVLGWSLLPLLTFGTDESLDPAQLVLFPLRRGPLMRGLLLASLVGVAPAAIVVVAAGAVLGYGQRAGAVLVVPAMVLLLLLAVASARTLTTMLASSLSSRRGRDVVIVIVALLALALQGLRFVKFSSIDPKLIDRVLGVLRWLPPGMLGQAVIDARDGRVALAVVQLVPPTLAIVALMRLWARSLDHSLTVVPGGVPVQRRRARLGLPLLFRRLPLLRPTPWGAIAAKELRYTSREPRRKVTVVNSVVLGIVAPVWVGARAGGGLRPASVLLATLAGYVVVMGARNQFGLDGGALWLDAVAGDMVRHQLLGKNLALLVEVVPVVALVGVALAALTGGWLFLPAALFVALAGLGAGLATANVASVRYPVRLPESRSPFAGGGGGQGCSTAVVLLVCALVQNVIIAPVVLAVAFTVSVAPVALVVVAPLCAVYGAAVWWAGLHLATGYARAHQPELLRAVDPVRSD